MTTNSTEQPTLLPARRRTYPLVILRDSTGIIEFASAGVTPFSDDAVLASDRRVA